MGPPGHLGLAPPGSFYKYQRVYPANTATLFALRSATTPSIMGTSAALEAEYNSYLNPHTRPVKTLRDLLINRTWWTTSP